MPNSKVFCQSLVIGPVNSLSFWARHTMHKRTTWSHLQANHKFNGTNIDFDFLTSPRFGHIRCLRSTRVIERGEELFINYGKTRTFLVLDGGVMISLFIGSKSGSRIAERLKIWLCIQIQCWIHNTSIDAMIPIFTGSEARSGIAKKLKIWLPGRNHNTSSFSWRALLYRIEHYYYVE